MKTRVLLLCLAVCALSGCAGIGSISGTAGYTSPTTGIVYGVTYTKQFSDGKGVKPLR